MLGEGPGQQLDHVSTDLLDQRICAYSGLHHKIWKEELFRLRECCRPEALSGKNRENHSFCSKVVSSGPFRHDSTLTSHRIQQ